MARIIWNPGVPVIYKSEKKRKLSLSESPGKDTPKHLYQSSLFTLFSVSHSAKNILLSQPVKKKKKSSNNELVLSMKLPLHGKKRGKKKKTELLAFALQPEQSFTKLPRSG